MKYQNKVLIILHNQNNIAIFQRMELFCKHNKKEADFFHSPVYQKMLSRGTVPAKLANRTDCESHVFPSLSNLVQREQTSSTKVTCKRENQFCRLTRNMMKDNRKR